MYCKKCGKKLEEGIKYCINCGTPTENIVVKNNVKTPTAALVFEGIAIVFLLVSCFELKVHMNDYDAFSHSSRDASEITGIFYVMSNIISLFLFHRFKKKNNLSNLKQLSNMSNIGYIGNISAYISMFLFGAYYIILALNY